MQKPAIVEKKIILWDGNEVPGLIRVQELKLSKSSVKVPGFKKMRTISSNIIEIPVLELKYAVNRNTITQKFWEDFFFIEGTIKDATEIRTDQFGNTVERRLWQWCECNDYQTPAYDAENPELMVTTVQVLAWDIKIL